MWNSVKILAHRFVRLGYADPAMLGGYLTRLMALYSACKVCNYKYKFRRLYWLREMYLIAAC